MSQSSAHLICSLVCQGVRPTTKHAFVIAVAPAASAMLITACLRAAGRPMAVLGLQACECTSNESRLLRWCLLQGHCALWLFFLHPSTWG